MKRSSRFGFTLLELLVVLAIIIVISSLGLPALRETLYRSEFREGVVMLQTELQRARSLAMETGVPYVFHYRPGTGYYEIMPKEEFLRHYPQNSNMGLGLNPDGSAGLGLSTGAETGSGHFEESSDQENLEPASDSKMVGTLRSADVADGFTESTGGLSDSSATEEGFGGTLNPDGTDFGTVSTEAQTEASLPLVTLELPGGASFHGGRISAMTPSNFQEKNDEISESDPISSTGGSEFSGTLSNPMAKKTGEESDGGILGSDPIFGDSQKSPENPLGAQTSMEQIGASWSVPLMFYPNGRTSHAVLYLKSPNETGFVSEVSLRGMTGVARINYIESR